MVYAGSMGKQTLHLGVSGRLLGVEETKASGVDVRNLVMWDPQTGSLWGQLKGEALQGPAKGTKLDMLPAVFVGLSTWGKMHPKTKVLNLSPMPGKDWHFTSKDLAKGKANDLDLAIALRHGDDTLAVPLVLLHRKGVVNDAIDGQSVTLVWHAEESAVLAYASAVGETPNELVLEGEFLRSGKRTWSALTGVSKDPKVAPLQRTPYIPTYLVAWKTYYPKGRVLED